MTVAADGLPRPFRSEDSNLSCIFSELFFWNWRLWAGTFVAMCIALGRARSSRSCPHCLEGNRRWEESDIHAVAAASSSPPRWMVR